jgi:hypothetical protein
MRSRGIDTKPIPLNLIYMQPSIEALSTFITSYAAAPAVETVGPSVDRAARNVEVDAWAAKYSADLPKHAGTQAVPAKRGAIITGTTGTLGSYLLESFAAADDISVIYAINRPSRAGGDHEERAKAALRERGIDVEKLDAGGKVRFVEADMSRADFGVTPELFEEVRCGEVVRSDDAEVQRRCTRRSTSLSTTPGRSTLTWCVFTGPRSETHSGPR